LETARNYSYALRFASEALRKDPEIQQAAKK
jgi:hypothetical protein